MFATDTRVTEVSENVLFRRHGPSARCSTRTFLAFLSFCDEVASGLGRLGAIFVSVLVVMSDERDAKILGGG